MRIPSPVAKVCGIFVTRILLFCSHIQPARRNGNNLMAQHCFLYWALVMALYYRMSQRI